MNLLWRRRRKKNKQNRQNKLKTNQKIIKTKSYIQKNNFPIHKSKSRTNHYKDFT